MSAGGEATLFPMTLTGFLPFSSHRVLWSLTLLLSCIVPVAVHIARRRRIAELISKIPGPTAAHPILGNLDVLYELKKYRHLLAPHILLLQTMCGLAQIHDKDRIFRFWLGFRPVVSFFKAETVEVILSSNTVLDKSFDYTLLHPWLGTGLLTSSGNKWRRRRKMLTPAFHFRILEDFIPVFNEQAVIFVKNLKEQQNKKYIDIVPLVTLCTLDIICETAMGVKVDAQLNSNSHYVRSLYEVGETFMARVMRPWLWPNYVFYMSSFGRKFKDNLAQLHNFTRKVIRERKAELLEQKVIDGLTIGEQVIGQKRRQAFLDLLLSHHIQDSSLTEEDIREEVDTFMFEGHDTTAMGISWAMYLIGLYTDVQQKIHEELDGIFGEDRERAITPDDLKEMKYLECALKESQRLFPSVPFIGRELMEDVVVNGYTVPRGTTCFLFTFMLHRDKEIFPNPEVFDPDRFRPENCVGRHPFAYVPFSAGPRNCIGQKFALMEEKVVLCSVLRNFCIQSVDFRDKIHLVAELVTRSKHGLKIRLRPHHITDPSRSNTECTTMFALLTRAVVWLVLSSSLALACLAVAVLGAVHAARRATWKWLRCFPGPNEDIPLRWVVQQHRHASSVKNKTPYNVSMLEVRIAYYHMFRKHGLFRFYIGPHPTVAVFRADYLEIVLNSKSTMEKSVDYEVLHSWLGTGLLTSSGEKWKTRRRLLTPAFHFRILDSFVQPMNARARGLVQKILQRSTDPWIDIVPLVAECTLSILLETIMGVFPEEEEEHCRSYVRAVHYLSSQISSRVQMPWLLLDAIYFRTAGGKEYKKSADIVHNFTAKVIKKRREELKSTDQGNLVEEKEESVYNRKRLCTFLDTLLRYSIENDTSFTDDDIREEVDTFMFEGHDTTSVAISWSLYMIGLHQDHQRKIQEELDLILEDCSGNDITSENLKELKYLDCVIKECQRLFPSVPITGRESVEDFKLGDYTIPKGSTIDVFIYALHRDPDVYPNPERFDPSRFLPENCISRHPYAFIPFSAGSRNCIGQRYAAMELKIIIATVLRNFNVIALDHRDKVRLSSDLVLRAADGIRLSFSPRFHRST
ncbi:uncharacterized protein LOC144115765 [Amblyomma americanum]